MSTVTRESEIVIYIKIELSLIEDKIKCYQCDIEAKKDTENYNRLMQNLTEQRDIIKRILRISENIAKE